MSETKDTEIRSKYDALTTEELMDELKTTFFCSGHITGDEVTKIEQILGVLREKDPLPDERSDDELWERFLEIHGEELSKVGIRHSEEVVDEEPFTDVSAVVRPELPAAQAAPKPVHSEARCRKGRRGMLRTAMVAAAVMLVAMVLITVSAGALGIDIWGWVPVWDDNTFRFVPEDTAATSVDIPTALKQLGVEEPLFPTWIPEGFLLIEQQVMLEGPIKLCCTYLHKNQTLVIYICSSEDDSLPLSLEKDYPVPAEYICQGVKHYIYSNIERTASSWSSQGYLVSIYGEISQEDMIRIIDSIYKETQ